MSELVVDLARTGPTFPFARSEGRSDPGFICGLHLRSSLGATGSRLVTGS